MAYFNKQFRDNLAKALSLVPPRCAGVLWVGGVTCLQYSQYSCKPFFQKN